MPAKETVSLNRCSERTNAAAVVKSSPFPGKDLGVGGKKIRAAFRDLALANYLERKTWKRDTHICRRISDGSLWAASSPQNLALAMAGLFSGEARWHFARAREWRGLLIVSPRTFWQPAVGRDFKVLYEIKAYWLPEWPQHIETEKIVAAQGIEARQGQDAKRLDRNDESPVA